MIFENHWPNMNLIELLYGMESFYQLIVDAYHLRVALGRQEVAELSLLLSNL